MASETYFLSDQDINPVKVHPEHLFRKPTHQIALNENIPNRKSKLTQIPLNTPQSSSKILKDKCELESFLTLPIFTFTLDYSHPTRPVPNMDMNNEMDLHSSPASSPVSSPNPMTQEDSPYLTRQKAQEENQFLSVLLENTAATLSAYKNRRFL
ncbi:hypothetical protein NPIL_234041 [Nephila pilipes]|uniref:Uncharacterized protein n=1 Tax=Nephila pilipes TaxID=299642 RepID=A0A8X6PU43_NEPPI|nr:hypothetical protein NPIL_234041 [Nephila pilipes]